VWPKGAGHRFGWRLGLFHGVWVSCGGLLICAPFERCQCLAWSGRFSNGSVIGQTQSAGVAQRMVARDRCKRLCLEIGIGGEFGWAKACEFIDVQGTHTASCQCP